MEDANLEPRSLNFLSMLDPETSLFCFSVRVNARRCGFSLCGGLGFKCWAALIGANGLRGFMFEGPPGFYKGSRIEDCCRGVAGIGFP